MSLCVEAVAWTAIALLATTLAGSFFHVGHRIDGLGGRIEAQGADLGRRIDVLGTRIDALGARMDDHLERHAG